MYNLKELQNYVFMEKMLFITIYCLHHLLSFLIYLIGYHYLQHGFIKGNTFFRYVII